MPWLVNRPLIVTFPCPPINYTWYEKAYLSLDISSLNLWRDERRGIFSCCELNIPFQLASSLFAGFATVSFLLPSVNYDSVHWEIDIDYLCLICTFFCLLHFVKVIFIKTSFNIQYRILLNCAFVMQDIHIRPGIMFNTLTRLRYR